MTLRVDEHAIVVDPRLAARRREIRRQSGRRRLRRVQVGLGAAGVGAVAWALALSPLLDVDRVSVRGAELTEADVVREVAGIEVGEAMVTLRLARAARGVEALPWVATATVTRTWPGEVGVTVTERRPLALMSAAGGGWLVVDGEGRHLTVTDGGAFPDLARIVGLDPEPQPGATLGESALPALELTALLAASLPDVGAEVAATEDGLELTLSNEVGDRVLVRFGDSSRLADKVDALAALVDADVMAAPAGPLVVDVRVPDAPVLTRAEG